MSTEHSKRAAKFTQNVEKTTWHDATFWSVRQKRDKMAEQLPEWEDLREHASEIKMHTITHLADYLDMFSKNLESRGVKVHWAKDAQEFNEIVLGILKDHNVKKMVKSKSMLTEECEMNPYLEQHGIDVVETDLGERIIQLLHQKPSHIVMPAIHLKREEVGKMFEEKGISKEIGNYDPTYLTRCARHHLRDQFMEAGAGMTGCNFGVAATGDCVVCTNEGNADMTTSMPKLHIVAMGIEKLVPDYKSLAVFQRLLCRCGTGQPTTAFTSHFRQARPGAEMHVVLVDNGRSDILADKDHWQTLKCMRCGACMNTCPVYRRSGGYSYTYFIPGPIGVNLGMLKNPDATILCYTYFTTNYTHISTIQVVGLSHGIRILLGNRNLRQVGSKDLGFRISLLHQLIQILTFLRLYHMTTYRFRHLNKLFQRILILDTLHIYGRHIELNVRILTQLVQEIFFLH
jgi:L-lactate dehydrogenase complex protein LldF